MTISLDDVKTALSIIENSEGSEIRLRSGDIELTIRRVSAGTVGSRVDKPTLPIARPVAKPLPSEPTSDAAKPRAAPGSAPSQSALPLRAPLSGVIYHAPSPEEPPFVTPGAEVDGETVVCIIDVMKVMNLIKSPAGGRISRIDVANGELVTKDDVILWVEPR